MNGARKLLLMVLVGILIAAGIITGVTALEQNHFIQNPPTSQTTVTSTTSTVITSIKNVNSSLPTGVLAAQITDPPNPPNVPAGTTHVYINYSDIEAHTTDQNNNSVWFTIANAGKIDLLSVINVGLTLGSAQVTSGIFDQVRFDIANATVTFGGLNYTAIAPMNGITIPLTNGGARVGPNASAGFVIDITPTVLAGSNGGKPSFELIPATMGVSIPSQSWNNSLSAAGSKIPNITSQTWWVKPPSIGNNLTEAVPAEIFPSFLLVILNNTGSTPVTISSLNILTSGVKGGSTVSTSTIVSTITTVATITEVTTITGNTSTQSATTSAMGTAPFAQASASSSSKSSSQAANSTSSPMTVATFLILSNGSVVQPTPNGAPVPRSQIGLTLKPYQDIVLIYFGLINTLNSPIPPNQPLSIIGGQEYTVQILTPFGSSASFSVNASYPDR
ncbi:MAG: DUF4382 domain-containing protein [Nitrososphaerales archaeon]